MSSKLSNLLKVHSLDTPETQGVIGNTSADWKDKVAADTTPVSRKGYILTGLTLGVFFIWGITFPLSSAVIATGKVISSGQNKLLQHPTGGVVRAISALEGNPLSKGQLIATIEPASAIAELSALTANRNLLVAKKTRLMAEKSGATDYILPISSSLNISGLRGSTSAIAADGDTIDLVYLEQEAEFNASSKRHQSELSVLQNQLMTLESDYYSRSEQLDQQKARLALLDQQYEGMEPLVEEGHIAKIRLWDLDANRLQVKGQVAELKGNLENLIGRMDEVRDQIKLTKATKQQENSRELTDVLSDLASIEDQIEAAEKIVEYSEIRAPVAGTLTNVAIHTIGGVVQGGETIAEIVPSNQPLQIEARVLPADVASVSLGQTAEVIITAFNRNLDDPIEGTVSYLAADSQIDEMTGEPYFIVRIDIEPAEHTAKRIMAGMFTEVYIQAASRTFMSYLAKPVTDSFRRAFQER